MMLEVLAGAVVVSMVAGIRGTFKNKSVAQLPAEFNLENVRVWRIKDFNNDDELTSFKLMMAMAGVKLDGVDIERQLRRIGNMGEEQTVQIGDKTAIVTPVPNTTCIVIDIVE